MRRRDTVSMSESCSETGLNCSINPPNGPALGNAGVSSGGGGGCNADEDLLQVRLLNTFFNFKDDQVERFDCKFSSRFIVSSLLHDHSSICLSYFVECRLYVVCGSAVTELRLLIAHLNDR